EEEAQGRHVEPSEFLEGAPVPHLGGAVEDPVDPVGAAPEGLGVLEVPGDLLDAPVVEPGRVAGGAHEGPDAMAAGEGLLDGMAADQACAAGDEDRPGVVHGPTAPLLGAGDTPKPNRSPRGVKGRRGPARVVCGGSGWLCGPSAL